MEIGPAGSNALYISQNSAQSAPQQTPPAASKKAPDTVVERKEAEKSDHDADTRKRDAQQKQNARHAASDHLGQSVDIAL